MKERSNVVRCCVRGAQSLLRVIAALALSSPAMAEVCTVGGVEYECHQPNYTPWRYTAYVEGNFPAPYGPTADEALAYSIARFEATFKPRVHSITYGPLAATEYNISQTQSWARMPVYIVWYIGAPMDTAYARVDGYRDASCQDGSKEYRMPWAPAPSFCYTPRPPMVIAIDPGHGTTCPQYDMPAGAVGATYFPANNPPEGFLREDALTVSFAMEIRRSLPPSKYRVILTKQDVHSCPSYIDRGRIANNANAKVFVSLHVNAPNPLGGSFPFGNGTSTHYHPVKPAARQLADQMARAVSSALGANNRGSFAETELAVLKPTVTKMTAVLLETARLSGSDEVALHSPQAPTRVADGVKLALDAFLGR